MSNSTQNKPFNDLPAKDQKEIIRGAMKHAKKLQDEVLGKYPQTIKNVRLGLRESQTQFGKRFGVSHASVSDWESGKSEAPYKVIEFVLEKGKEPMTQNDWEKRFDSFRNFDGCEYGSDLHHRIKSFFRQELSDTRKEVLEGLAVKMKKLKIKAGQTNGNPIDGWKELKFVDIEDVLATLREEEKE